MRVLITGGTGSIGRELAASLAGDGHDVILLSRNSEQVTGLPAVVRVERWDGRTGEGWSSLGDGADAIVNLAGENIGADRWTTERKERIRQSRLNAGRAVVETVTRVTRKPRVVIQASAVGYYGPHGPEQISEETPAGQDFLAQVCVDWEASTVPVEALGVRRAVIRTGVALSKRGGALPRMMLPFRFFMGGRLGNGRQWVPWIHIKDEVRAIRFLIENESASGAFNLTAPHPVTNAEFAHTLGRQLNRPSFVPAPAFALRTLFGEMATILLDGQRAVSQRLSQLGFDFEFPELGPALGDLFR